MGAFDEFRISQIKSCFRAVAKEDFQDVDPDRCILFRFYLASFVHFIMIEWHSGLHGLDTITKLGPCNLPTASYVFLSSVIFG